MSGLGCDRTHGRSGSAQIETNKFQSTLPEGSDRRHQQICGASLRRRVERPHHDTSQVVHLLKIPDFLFVSILMMWYVGVINDENTSMKGGKMPIRLEVWGENALFSRSEFKTERVTYDVMTPSAARGILEAILWHPGMRWRIDRIHVLNPIRFDSIRRNEVDSVINIGKIRTMAEGRGDGGAIYTAESIQQRSSTILRDVRYVIDAHFELNRARMSSTDSAEKFQSMFMRRAAKGQCFHHPYFGTREFPVEFQLWQESGDPVGFEHGHRDLGYMLYDFDYRNPAHPVPLFFRAELDDGVLDVESVEVRS